MYQVNWIENCKIKCAYFKSVLKALQFAHAVTKQVKVQTVITQVR